MLVTRPSYTSINILGLSFIEFLFASSSTYGARQWNFRYLRIQGTIVLTIWDRQTCPREIRILERFIVAATSASSRNRMVHWYLTEIKFHYSIYIYLYSIRLYYIVEYSKIHLLERNFNWYPFNWTSTDWIRLFGRELLCERKVIRWEENWWSPFKRTNNIYYE